MSPRYGNVPRTPVSRRAPDLLHAPPPVPSPAPSANPLARASADELVQRSLTLTQDSSYRVHNARRFATRRVLQWLQGFPAETWQDRWLLAGGDSRPPGSGPEQFDGPQRWQYFTGVGVLIVVGAIRPSYPWLFGNRPQHIYDAYRRNHQPETFAELERLATLHVGSPTHAKGALTILTRLTIVTGKDLRQLHFHDLSAYAAARAATGRYTTALALAYDLLRAIGGLAGAAATFKQANARGKRTVAELVDRYPIANRAMRDVLVHYLAERAPSLDYNSLSALSQILAEHFWGDLERHHPGIDSLRLPDDVVHAWKLRIRVRPDGRPRLGYEAMLLAVRAFYLDLQHWAMEEPAVWGLWSAPCPITEADMRGTVKEKRRRQARMHERTRTLVPVLPRLVAAAEQHLARATRVLQAARTAQPGDEFTVDDVTYQRTGKPTKFWQP